MARELFEAPSAVRRARKDVYAVVDDDESAYSIPSLLLRHTFVYRILDPTGFISRLSVPLRAREGFRSHALYLVLRVVRTSSPPRGSPPRKGIDVRTAPVPWTSQMLYYRQLGRRCWLHTLAPRVRPHAEPLRRVLLRPHPECTPGDYLRLSPWRITRHTLPLTIRYLLLRAVEGCSSVYDLMKGCSNTGRRFGRGG